MTAFGYSNLTLCRRLARHTRSSWTSVAVLLGVGLLAAPLALLTPLPLKIAVDSALGSHPMPRFLDALVPAAVTGAPTVLLIFVAALTVLIAPGQPFRLTAPAFPKQAKCRQSRWW